LCTASPSANLFLQLFQLGNEASVKIQEGAPPGLLLAVLFEISEPLDFDWMDEGSGTIRDKKFRSWAVPFGIYTHGQLNHIVIRRGANLYQVLNGSITSSS
jgi:hypothetical protein